jgi:hypothetical protein
MKNGQVFRANRVHISYKEKERENGQKSYGRVGPTSPMNCSCNPRFSQIIAKERYISGTEEV